MRPLLSGFNSRRSSAGHLIVELNDATIVIKLIVGLLLTSIAWAWFSFRTPIGASLGLIGWKIVGILVVLLALVVGSSFWLRSRSRFRITVDRTRSVFLVDTHKSRSEYPLSDVMTVGFKKDASIDGVDTYYILELALRSGERAAVDTDFIAGYRAGDRENAVRVINQELDTYRRSRPPHA